jgi:hypothetical protein
MRKRNPILLALAAQAIFIILMIKSLYSPGNTIFAQSYYPNEDVYFGLIPKGLGSPYSISGIKSNELNPIVFFQSEPIILELMLTNFTKSSIPIAGTKGRWISLIEWQILKDGTVLDQNIIKMVDRSAEVKLDSFGKQIKSNSVEILNLGVGEGIKKEISIVSPNGFQLPFGKYKVSILLKPNSLGSQFPQPNRAIPAQADFIVKKIESLGDRLNYFAHLVQRHFIDKEYDKAHGAIKDMIALEQNSIFAYTMLGEIYCLQDKPQQSSESLKKAIMILENNLDKNHRLFNYKPLREDQQSILKERLALGPCRKRS